MMGQLERIATEAARYSDRFGAQARFQLSDDLSRAIGSHDWDRAHLLHGVNGELLDMESAGIFDCKTA